MHYNKIIVSTHSINQGDNIYFRIILILIYPFIYLIKTIKYI